jgi:hypothetical protein
MIPKKFKSYRNIPTHQCVINTPDKNEYRDAIIN